MRDVRTHYLASPYSNGKCLESNRFCVSTGHVSPKLQKTLNVKNQA